MGLAEAWWSRVCDEAEESKERLAAADNLAQVRLSDGQYAEAERIHRKVLGARRRVLGEEHPDTLTSANNLAVFLAYQGKHAEAEEILQAALAARRRVLGSAHPDTLATAEDLEVVRLDFLRSEMRAKQPTKKGAKAAARKERVAAAPLSPTALAEVEARAAAAAAELMSRLRRGTSP